MADQLISTVVHEKLPENYVRPETQRPRLDEVLSDAQIPVVDLADPDLAAVVARIGEACTTHGFFQVLNHGVPVELMHAMVAVAYDFFRLPAEEKAKLYSDDDPAKKMPLSMSFNVRKKTVHNWRDYLRLHCHPLEQQYVPEWPANPPSFREIVSAYCKEVQELGFRLYAAISANLGLDEEVKKTLGEQEQQMAVNFYPKCPAPELTYGLPAYTDPNALTILLMDQQVAGLQVLKEGTWIAVNPRPNALVISIGDQLQELSNGRYKRVWCRAVVNSDRPGMIKTPSEHSTILATSIAAPSEPKELVIKIVEDQLQVRVDEIMGAKAGDPIAVGDQANREGTGSDHGRRGEGPAVVGIIAASAAVTGIVAGVISPAVAFGYYLVLLCGLYFATAGARNA